MPRGGGGSLWGTALTLAKVCTGAGLLGVPYAFERSGLMLGLVLGAFVAWLNCVGVRLLIAAKRSMLRRHQRLSIDEQRGLRHLDVFALVGWHSGGSIMVHAVNVSFVLTLFGACTVYLWTTATLLDEVWSAMLSHSSSRAYSFTDFVMLVWAAVLPFCFLPDLSFLKFTSFTGVACYVLLYALVFYQAGMASDQPMPTAAAPQTPPLHGHGSHAGVASHDAASSWHRFHASRLPPPPPTPAADVASWGGFDFDTSRLWFVGSYNDVMQFFMGNFLFAWGVPLIAFAVQEAMAEPEKLVWVTDRTLVGVLIAYVGIGFVGDMLYRRHGLSSMIISDLLPSHVSTVVIKALMVVNLVVSVPTLLLPLANVVSLYVHGRPAVSPAPIAPVPSSSAASSSLLSSSSPVAKTAEAFGPDQSAPAPDASSPHASHASDGSHPHPPPVAHGMHALTAIKYNKVHGDEPWLRHGVKTTADGRNSAAGSDEEHESVSNHGRTLSQTLGGGGAGANAKAVHKASVAAMAAADIESGYAADLSVSSHVGRRLREQHERLLKGRDDDDDGADGDPSRSGYSEPHKTHSRWPGADAADLDGDGRAYARDYHVAYVPWDARRAKSRRQGDTLLGAARRLKYLRRRSLDMAGRVPASRARRGGRGGKGGGYNNDTWSEPHTVKRGQQGTRLARQQLHERIERGPVAEQAQPSDRRVARDSDGHTATETTSLLASAQQAPTEKDAMRTYGATTGDATAGRVATAKAAAEAVAADEEEHYNARYIFWRRALYRISIWTMIALVTLHVPCFSIIVSFVSAVSLNMLTLIIPAFVYARLVVPDLLLPNDDESGDGHGGGTKHDSSSSSSSSKHRNSARLHLYGCYALIVGGFYAMFYMVWLNIESVRSGAPC